MSTNQPQVATRRLYVGKEETLGKALTKMVGMGRGQVRRNISRWKENERFYRGDAYATRGGTTLQEERGRVVAPLGMAPHDRSNRIRGFIEGRCAQYAASRPPAGVEPDGRERGKILAARLATKLVDANWGEEGWRIDSASWDVAIGAETRGVGCWAVMFDRSYGEQVEIMLDAETGLPVTDEAREQALRAEDPAGRVLWRGVKARPGSVRFRPIHRLATLLIDPMAIDSPEDACWIGESRAVSRALIEAEAGATIQELQDRSKAQSRERMPASITDAHIEDDATGARLRDKDAVIVHEIFVLPGAEFPEGLHAKWLEVAANAPLITEPWQRGLPYFFFIPRRSPGHWLESRGTVDDIKGLQVRYDRTLVLTSEVLLRMARPPWAIPVGAMQDDSPYNEKGFFNYHSVLGEPHEARVSGEPAVVLSQHLPWIVNEMGEGANLPAVARGTPPGQGVESAVALQALDQNKEQQMAGTAAAWVRLLERSIAYALGLVEDFYTLPRMVTAPGVDAPDELRAFTGDMLRGQHRWRVRGSVMPRTRAAQLQSFLQLLPILGPAVTPWLPKIIGESDVAEWVAHGEQQADKQSREIDTMLSVAALPQKDAVWQRFQAEVTSYQRAFAAAQSAPTMIPQPPQPTGLQAPAQTGGNGGSSSSASSGPQPQAPPHVLMHQPPPVPMDPKQMLTQQGISEPRITDHLREAGVSFPSVDPHFDEHPSHIRVLKDFGSSPAFDDAEPIVKQLIREHLIGHLAEQTRQLLAQGMQMPMEGVPQGSPPAAKGTPSPPRPPGATGGTTPMPIGATP